MSVDIEIVLHETRPRIWLKANREKATTTTPNTTATATKKTVGTWKTVEYMDTFGNKFVFVFVVPGMVGV